jgi:hypothetical protein
MAKFREHHSMRLRKMDLITNLVFDFAGYDSKSSVPRDKTSPYFLPRGDGCGFLESNGKKFGCISGAVLLR